MEGELQDWWLAVFVTNYQNNILTRFARPHYHYLWILSEMNCIGYEFTGGWIRIRHLVSSLHGSLMWISTPRSLSPGLRIRTGVTLNLEPLHWIWWSSSFHLLPDRAGAGWIRRRWLVRHGRPPLRCSSGIAIREIRATGRCRIHWIPIDSGGRWHFEPAILSGHDTIEKSRRHVSDNDFNPNRQSVRTYKTISWKPVHTCFFCSRDPRVVSRTDPDSRWQSSVLSVPWFILPPYMKYELYRLYTSVKFHYIILINMSE